MTKSELPHGAWIDSDKEKVIIPIGHPDGAALTLSFDQLLDFADRFNDILIIFQSNTEVTDEYCTTCGAVNSKMEYVEPGGAGDEYN